MSVSVTWFVWGLKGVGVERNGAKAFRVCVGVKRPLEFVWGLKGMELRPLESMSVSLSDSLYDDR